VSGQPSRRELARAAAAARRWQRAGGARRGLGATRARLAAALAAAALALASGTLAHRPGQVATAAGVAVLVAARDLAPGAVPGPADVRVERLPAAAVPADALPPSGPRSAPLALGARRGDLLTRRLLDGGRPRPPPRPPGLRAFALPLGDGVEAGPLLPGDRVDVLAASGHGAATVLRAVPVLRTVPGGDGRAPLVLLGVSARQAEALAAARAAGALTLVQAPG
jgi:Flp pilus assembly protein CpaB